MAVKTFGTLSLTNGEWHLTGTPPHVCIKLKAVFPKISKTAIPPFRFKHTPENCSDLVWFSSRYPMEIAWDHRIDLDGGKRTFDQTARQMEEILLPSYKPEDIELNIGEKARDYQLKAAVIHAKSKRMLLGDDVGLGKTLSAILTLVKKETLPAVVTVQTHLTKQWKREIERFTRLRVHIINIRSPYNLPVADVYIIKYSCLWGWTDIFHTGIFKSCIFDEVQELRRPESNKYKAAKILSNSVG